MSPARSSRVSRPLMTPWRLRRVSFWSSEIETWPWMMGLPAVSTARAPVLKRARPTLAAEKGRYFWQRLRNQSGGAVMLTSRSC